MNSKWLGIWIVVAVTAASIGATVLYVVTLESSYSNGDRTFADSLGREVSLPQDIDRVISLQPSTTEIIFVVGGEDRLVGVDENSDYPPEVEGIETVGSWIVDVEKVVALDPDVVLTDTLTSEETVDTLEGHDLPVVVLEPPRMADMIENIRLVGEILGEEANANAAADSLEQRIYAVVEAVNGTPAVSVLLEYFPYWTYGQPSYGNDIISLAGGNNIASTSSIPFPNINDEFVLTANPDVIVYTVGPAFSQNESDIAARPGWDQTNAVIDDRIYSIDDNLIARSGPRSVDGLEGLAELLHPDAFE